MWKGRDTFWLDLFNWKEQFNLVLKHFSPHLPIPLSLHSPRLLLSSPFTSLSFSPLFFPSPLEIPLSPLHFLIPPTPTPTPPKMFSVINL